MIITLLILFVCLLCYLLGWLAGYFNSTGRTIHEIVVKKAKSAVSKINPPPQIPTGQIKTPTAKEIWQKNRPQREKEGIAEMKKSLDLIPELARQKELTQKLKKAGML